MRLRLLVLLPFVFFLFVAARQRAVTHPVAGPLDRIPEDHYSSSEPEKVRIRHLSLDLTVDFERKVVSGSATLLLHHLSETRSLVLDARALDIRAVTVDGAPVAFTYERERERLALPIEPSSRAVTIAYSSAPGSGALEWVTAEQSFGRQRPFVYSTNRPDEARSWLPLQDTPAVRMTYDATLRVPPGMLALMSAENPTAVDASGVYPFRMPYPVPAHLVAMAAGRLEFRPLDARSGVYAEPELLDDAQWELQYVPRMLEAAERLAGPYPFGRFDLLLLPPPFLGNAHPRLNFLNALGAVTLNRPAQPEPSGAVAQLVAASWAGGQTTAATWGDAWLNDDVAWYLRMRILEEVISAERAEYELSSARGTMVATIGRATFPRTLLLHRPYVQGEPVGWNLDSNIKGMLFLRTLEESLGRPAFDAMLRDYFRRFAWRWIDDRNFIAFLTGSAVDTAAMLVDEWIYEPTLPANVKGPTTSALAGRINDEMRAFRFGAKISELDMTGWGEFGLDLFLQRAFFFMRDRMAEVDAHLHLSDRSTPPTFWMVPAVEYGYAPALPVVERVLARGGSSHALLLYTSLARTPATKEMARRLFASYRGRYHPEVAAQVEALLK